MQKKDIPAIGFSMGVDRIMNIYEVEGRDWMKVHVLIKILVDNSFIW